MEFDHRHFDAQLGRKVILMSCKMVVLLCLINQLAVWSERSSSTIAYNSKRSRSEERRVGKEC